MLNAVSSGSRLTNVTPVRSAGSSSNRVGRPSARWQPARTGMLALRRSAVRRGTRSIVRSEEHTSELQSHSDLVCRLLLEKKKKKKNKNHRKQKNSKETRR